MERHFHAEINELKQNLLKMAGLVEASIDKAIRSLTDRNEALAQEVIDADPEINHLEIEIENQCINLLARHQPVAIDLRMLVAAVKMNSDLERMGDHAVNIAERAQQLLHEPPLKPLIDIPRMAVLVQEMVRNSLDAFVAGDVGKARAVCESDDLVDGLETQINRELLSYMIETPSSISRAINLSVIAKNLERIADISTTICEETIFLVEARTIKHRYGLPTSKETPRRSSDRGKTT